MVQTVERTEDRAAAKTGADVVLLERYNHLGGLSTGGLVICGQAAGVAAAIAANAGVQPRAVNVREAQSALSKRGVFIRDPEVPNP
jgi:hypothetical protein